MAETKPQFANFKDAFCAYYRVPEEKYGRAVLWRALPFTRRLLAMPILWFNHMFFATDLDIIRSLGPIQSSENFSLQLDELHAVNRLERNLRRGFLGIRASGSRLMALWKTVEPYVTPPDRSLPPQTRRPSESPGSRPPTEPAPPNGSQRPSPGAFRAGAWGGAEPLPATDVAIPLPVNAPADPLDVSALVVRRLKRACDDLVSGIPLPEAVANAGLDSVPQFLRLLDANSSTQPNFRWLREQIHNADRLQQLEDENNGLKSVLAEQTVELARIRGAARR